VVEGIKYNSKLIKSGNVYEIVTYEKFVRVGEQTNNVHGRSVRANEESKPVHRKDTLRKAKTSIRRLINSNIDRWGETTKFLTLTFAENIQDIKEANYEFKKFRQRLEYELKVKLKYVTVIEFQKRGSIHYHTVFFNLPYVKNEDLAAIWRQGFIRINKVNDVDNIGAYVTKYMTKEQQDKEKEDRLVGQKSYFTSRGLFKPEETVNKKEIEEMAVSLSQHKVYESTFENEHLGVITYRQYNTKRNL
jgi:hypothetical protein